MGITFKRKCHKCGKQGHKVTECPQKGNGGYAINGTFHVCGEPGHNSKRICEKEKNTDRRLTGWVRCEKKNESCESKDAAATSVEVVF